MQRRSAAVPERRHEDLPRRPRADQTRHRLVLEERLPVDVGGEARK
jgi:hypothetical protein